VEDRESHPNLSIPFNIIEYFEAKDVVFRIDFCLQIMHTGQNSIFIYSLRSKRYVHLLVFDTLLDRSTP
jgi:hypothetical protein